MKYFETRLIAKDFDSGFIRIFRGPKIPAGNVNAAVKRCKKEYPYLIVVGDSKLDIPEPESRWPLGLLELNKKLELIKN